MSSLPFQKRVDRILDSPKAIGLFLASIAAVYILAYLGHPARPGNIYPEGWWGWWDQSQYLKCTAGLAHGILSKETFFYPLGYSLVAAPFYLWTPVHAYFLPNLVFVIGSVWAFHGIARRLLRPTEVFLLIIAFLVFYEGTLRDTLIPPWNTIPTHFLAYIILYLTAFRQPSERDVHLASICLALIYPFKIPEFLFLFPAIAIAVVSLREKKRIIRAASVLVVTVGIVIGTMFAVTFSVFGRFQTDYELLQRDIGILGYPPFWKVYLLFVSGGPAFREGDQMILSHAPWLLLMVPGIVYLVRKQGFQALGLILGLVLCFGLYVNYNELNQGNVYRYCLIHYFTWALPLLALITFVGLREAWKTRLGRWSLCSIPLLLALVCFVTLREKPVAGFSPGGAPTIRIPEETARSMDWIVLRGAKALPAKLVTNGRGWHYAGDYQCRVRTDGVVIVPSRRVAGKAFEITPQNPEDIERVEFGKLAWTVRWSPKWLLYQWTRRFTGLRVSILGQVPGTDVAGPSGSPDGAPDEVITLALPRWVAGLIKDWQIELPDNRGTWFTSATVQGNPIITASHPPNLQGATAAHAIELRFSDNGNFDGTGVILIRGFDSLGQVVVESRISRR